MFIIHAAQKKTKRLYPAQYFYTERASLSLFERALVPIHYSSQAQAIVTAKALSRL